MISRRSLIAGLAATPVAVALGTLAEAGPALAAEAAPPFVLPTVGPGGPIRVGWLVRFVGADGFVALEQFVEGDERRPSRVTVAEGDLIPGATYRLEFVRVKDIDRASWSRAGPEPG